AVREAVRKDISRIHRRRRGIWTAAYSGRARSFEQIPTRSDLRNDRLGLVFISRSLVDERRQQTASNASAEHDLRARACGRLQPIETARASLDRVRHGSLSFAEGAERSRRNPPADL